MTEQEWQVFRESCHTYAIQCEAMRKLASRLPRVPSYSVAVRFRKLQSLMRRREDLLLELLAAIGDEKQDVAPTKAER